MKFELILAVDSGDGEITNVPLAQMTRPDVSELATLGLSLCESKQLLAQHVEVAANAFVAAECTPVASGANPSHRRPSSPGLRTMVPGLYRQRRNPPTQRLTPPNRTLSFTLLEYLQFGERHTSPNGRSPFTSPN